MHEECRFLDLNGEHIFCGLHRPAQPASRGVVMCHPLGEEKLWSHRVFVSFARDLAAAGIAVLRFDFRGEGDSSRDFQEADLETRIRDTCLAVDALREFIPSVTDVTLVGLRLGASVAAAAAVRRSDVARLVLWDPVIDGAAYMQAVLRLNLMYQMAIHRRVIENREALVARLGNGETINIEGYEVAAPLYRQVTEFRLQDVLRDFAGETVVLQINPGETPVKPELVALMEAIPRCRVDVVPEEPFWKEITTFYQRAQNLTRASLSALGIPP
jgi:exosortase A-associated hydrolase 2